MCYRHIGGRNRFDQRSFYGQRISVDDLNYKRPRIPWREHDDPQKEHVTVWTVFSASTDYIPATQPLMINYIVDDMDALLDRLKQRE